MYTANTELGGSDMMERRRRSGLEALLQRHAPDPRPQAGPHYFDDAPPDPTVQPIARPLAGGTGWTLRMIVE